MKCKNCGNDLMDNWAKCPYCGTTIEKTSVCSGCGSELQPGWTRCPICGQKTGGGDDKILPSLDSMLSSDGDLDLVAGDIAEAKQRMKEEAKAEYQKKLTLARVACIRKNYQQAQAIYEDLLAVNAEDINAYIGFVRIVSQNYSILESSEIEEAIRVAKQVTGVDNLSKYDKEFADYSAKRKAHFDAIAEAERKAKEEAERKAKAEAERKRKEEEERLAKLEAERKAKAAAERKAKLEAERKAKAEAERKAKEEEERKRLEAERKVKEEAERKLKEEQLRIAKLEAERKAKEDAERRRKAEAARKAKEAAERKRREEEAKIAEEKARADSYRNIVSAFKHAQECKAKGEVEQEYELLRQVTDGCIKLGNYKDCNYYKTTALGRINRISDKVKKIRSRRSRKIKSAANRPTVVLYVVELLLIFVDMLLLASAHRQNWGLAFVIIGLDIVVHLILHKAVVKKHSPNTDGPYYMTFILLFVYIIVAVCAVPPVGHTDVLFDHSMSGGINILWNVLITIAEIIVLGLSKIGSAAFGLSIK